MTPKIHSIWYWKAEADVDDDKDGRESTLHLSSSLFQGEIELITNLWSRLFPTSSVLFTLNYVAEGLKIDPDDGVDFI